MNTQITTKQAIKKAEAVEQWKLNNGHITNVCKNIGIERKTFYNWLNNDPEFAEALLDAEAGLNDDIRDVLIEKAAAGDMTAVIFYLKNKHPEFKQEKSSLMQQINVGTEKGNTITFVNFKNESTS